MFSHQKIAVLVGDVIALIAAFCIMAITRFNVGAQGGQIWYQLKLFAILFIVWLIVFFIFDLYTARRINPNPRNIGLIIAAMIINTLLAVLLFYLVPHSGITPKTNLLILVLSAIALLVAWRRIYYLLFTKQFVRKILLIGNSSLMHNLVTELSLNRHIGVVVAHWETVPYEKTSIAVDLIIADDIDPQQLLHISREIGAETMSLMEAYETILAKLPIQLMTPERALPLLTNRSTAASRALYRILEIIVASIVLIITSPFVAIALLMKWLEDGTPLYIVQPRVGKDGKVFNIYKIRTMKALNKDGSAEINGAAVWADKKDPRVTKVGHILRITHLDEVPQMWNIIKGDLALIGPRAERPEFVTQLEQQIPYYYLRHTIKPGFTGWAQIKFRYARSIEDSREKFEYDLYYLKNKNTLLDLGILVKTIQIIFTH